MKKTIYIFSSGKLQRKDNSLILINKNGKSYIPIEVVSDMYVFGEITINSSLLNFLSQKNILIHFFNYYGFYTGTFYPKETKIAGKILVAQVKHYLDKDLRLDIAKRIINSASYNIFRNLRYYNGRNKNLEKELKIIEKLRLEIDNQNTISSLMGIEGNIRENYYTSWNKIVDYKFEKRIKKPPDNIINTLISFVNSLIYTTTLSEIYKTYLNPTISFLHEPGERRFSLSLDISEIFKPLIVDRMIFTLLNKKMITEKDFLEKLNGLYLKESARKIILKEYDERLNRKIFHKELKKNVSYKFLIRLECYKIIKHLLKDKEYEGFKLWW
ncbi:CRISPR-associated protein, Cas1 family [Marinitoga hydrogenitolerans DSM 16785]|uniref:CRISPR-associated endonuclease Cas1 n=1 Tax=Marinitoga hydrogenitolerans (strain DSM 16785 / JCM 12826 / AT1271) TaxID=1122195 RepID=A0A1M4Z470_MARH1|nr:type I-B CRISPR-associated endonuclease Cas1b [Marinitoga hydrogenitolerans]SHF12841.1 CRISPR-associated protein, Cas1 family [Marinitoga hydrogenitolerans DSM 16785]